MRKFTEQELVRREKAKKLKDMGLDPFGQKFDRTDFSKDIKDKFIDIPHDEFEDRNDLVTVAGRIMFIRKMGKASFFTIKDKLGSIQIYISINDIGEEKYNLFKEESNNDLVIDLSKNFRSRKEVLNSINLLFKNVMNLSYGGADYNNGIF